MLGFKPAGSVLHLGRSTAAEDIWLTAIPDPFFDDPLYKPTPGESTFTDPTILSRRHYRMILSFFLYVFAVEGIASVRCNPDDYYAVDLDSDSCSWEFADNFTSVPLFLRSHPFLLQFSPFSLSQPRQPPRFRTH
jgi:hypothetical protein